jgi:hypothetical protein
MFDLCASTQFQAQGSVLEACGALMSTRVQSLIFVKSVVEDYFAPCILPLLATASGCRLEKNPGCDIIILQIGWLRG